MKRILYTLNLLTATLLVSCEKDQDNQAVLSNSSIIEATWSASTIVLEQTKADETALTVAWKTSSNLSITPTYFVEFSYNNVKNRVATASSPFTMTVQELNTIITKLGVKANTAIDVKVAVKGDLNNFSEQVASEFRTSLTSAEQTLKVTSYIDLIIPTEWGVVGDLTGWGAKPDVPFWKIIGNNNETVAYVTLEANKGFKIRKGGDWNKGGNLGAKEDSEKQITLGTEKVLYNDGGSKDMFVTESGIYRILFNESKLSIKVEKYTWGIVGDGANGWDADKGTDIPLTYDGATHSWKAQNVTLKDGQIKFRLNNKWDTNYGADTTTDPAVEQSGAAGVGGKNIKVSAGTYNITFSFDEKTQKGTYKIEKL